jgi:23S rRNA (uridine2552-2'-O)-methyltransferase
LVPIDPLPHPQVSTLVGNVSDSTVLAAARELLGRPADVVLSDAAPKLSGVRARDEAACEELAAAVLEAVPQLLAAGGTFVMKTFMGPWVEVVRGRLRGSFGRVQLVRPASSRQGSSESYVVALEYAPRSGC